MSVDVYVLAGEQNTGKTSIIRFLSGKDKQTLVSKSIEINANTKISVELLFKTQSLQEGKKSAENFKETVQSKLSQKHFSAVILAIRTDSKSKLPTSAESYLDDFVSFGWNIKRVAELCGGKVLERYCNKKNTNTKLSKKAKLFQIMNYTLR